MASYATSQQFRDRFGDQETLNLVRVTLRSSTSLGATELAVVDRQLATATAWIQGYLPQPLTTVPQILVDYAMDVARFRMDFLEPREQVIEAYKVAERYMRMVASGQITLVDATQAVVDVDGGPTFVGGSPSVFNDAGTTDYLSPWGG